MGRGRKGLGYKGHGGSQQQGEHVRIGGLGDVMFAACGVYDGRGGELRAFVSLARIFNKSFSFSLN